MNMTTLCLKEAQLCFLVLYLEILYSLSSTNSLFGFKSVELASHCSKLSLCWLRDFMMDTIMLENKNVLGDGNKVLKDFLIYFRISSFVNDLYPSRKIWSKKSFTITFIANFTDRFNQSASLIFIWYRSQCTNTLVTICYAKHTVIANAISKYIAIKAFFAPVHSISYCLIVMNGFDFRTRGWKWSLCRRFNVVDLHTLTPYYFYLLCNYLTLQKCFFNNYL